MSRGHDEQPSSGHARDHDREKDGSDIGEVIGAPGEGVLRGWETYSRAELDRILPRFDLGHIEVAREYRRGSRSAPKLKISTERGEFLLKRRLLERHPVARIRYSHALQAALARQGFPVAPLLADRSTGDTLIVAGEYAYEMFRFVIGERYDKTVRGAARAGDALARLHRITRDFDTSQAVPASFHNSQTVRSALSRLPASVRRVDPGVDEKYFGDAVRYLEETYARAIEEIRDLGFAGLRPSAVHGDWHPGNVIFQRGSSNFSVAAVIDFDSTRSEPWITEIANGMAQFAIRGEGGTSPLDWPADFDARRLQAFLHGYLGASPRPVTLEERSMIPWLMVEAIIAESAVPVANQGSFADLPGAAFMDLVARKCEWVRQHRKAISAL
ncbi:MAG: phosphotransferase [Phycisphaerae bacterium]|jgi:Ser/Thr protein kinase RdoA (MazF antagonist)|nr:phosphotransferase [Phycisphaerae bacterium]